jgi:hypothetical protein
LFFLHPDPDPKTPLNRDKQLGSGITNLLIAIFTSFIASLQQFKHNNNNSANSIFSTDATTMRTALKTPQQPCIQHF